MGIQEFEKIIRAIGEKWFSDNESSDTEDLEKLEEYIVDGGIFGIVTSGDLFKKYCSAYC